VGWQVYPRRLCSFAVSERRSGQEPSAVLSQTAADRLREELERLKGEGRATMSVRLQHARELGDIRENAEYDAAKNEQGLMEARIRQLEHMLHDVQVVEVAEDADEITEGMLVTLRSLDDDDEDDETYLIAHSKEERAKGARTITGDSPLGKIILGKRVGDRVTYAAPGGEFSYEVVSFEPYSA
jgi:transcription elongation factor GreA